MGELTDLLSRRVSGKHTVILGIGNRQRGDDGAGPDLVRRLKGKVSAVLIDGGEVPENHLGQIESAHPQAILVVDCINMGAQPGEIAILNVDQLFAYSGSTHNPGLGLLGQVLQKTTGADVAILAIQPEQIKYGKGFSDKVKNTLNVLEILLQKALTGEM